MILNRQVIDIEVVDFIQSKKLSYCLGNVVKYISSASGKNADEEMEDLETAAWYINRRVAELMKEKREKEKPRRRMRSYEKGIHFVSNKGTCN